MASSGSRERSTAGIKPAAGRPVRHGGVAVRRRKPLPAPNAAEDARDEHESVGPPPVLRRRRGRFRWEHTDLEPYKLAMQRAGEFAGASRQVLIGKRGERVAFHVRYFELEAGGYTSLERHRHSHVVIAVRGRGVARVGNEQYALKPLDTIYIGPGQAHQLRASGRSRFGFFCIVDARRDKPRPVESA